MWSADFDATKNPRLRSKSISRRDRPRATITKRHEGSLENYLDRNAILEARSIDVRVSDDDDVAERCILVQHPNNCWSDMAARGRSRLRNPAKCWLNTLAVDRMSSGYAWVWEHLGQQRADDLRARADQVLARLRAQA